MENTAEKTHQVISPEELLKHWQGHRSLTRKVIEAFPEKELFAYSIGGMRPFAEMIKELLGIAGPGIKGIVTGDWNAFNDHFEDVNTKEKLLERWDKTTKIINEYWPKISAEKFSEQIVCFNQYEGTVISSLFYFFDNEIHHRGQAYVYLRSLNIEPPYFWER